MSQISGWYYLHENGSLIYKNNPDAIADIRDSDLCLSAWPISVEDRSTAWAFLVEAGSLGVDKQKINELIEKWKCNDEDAVHYAQYVGIDLGEDGNQKTAAKKDFINPQESPMGFGDTYLQAMQGLCHELGYKGGKMWNAVFESLVKCEKSEA